MDKPRILFVDDDENILHSFRRSLTLDATIETALGAEAGLDLIRETGSFAVVISDLRMPVMDGVQFLGRVKESCPDSVRMMLSGNIDLESSIKAVNEGNIFRLLTKPCQPHILHEAVEAGIEQYRLITAEKELLQNTLAGTIKVLTDILAMADPESFGRATFMRSHVRRIASILKVEKPWEIELAWMLSEIGYVTVPPSILVKRQSGERLTKAEEAVVARVPQIGKALLDNIPRLEAVTTVIAYQYKHYDGKGPPQNGVDGDDIPLGGRILKVVSDLSQLVSRGIPYAIALKKMTERSGW